MEDLIRCQEFAKQQQLLLKGIQIPNGNGILSSIEELNSKILQSIANGISKLNLGETTDEDCQSPRFNHVDSPCSDDTKTVDPGVCRKIFTPKKIGSKRRKNEHTWVKLTPTPIEDGRAWRKYGQKEILNAKFPRSYFRCTHKTDQGCQATKQIQKTEDEPPMYKTTYIGHHTCNDSLKAPQFILDTLPTETTTCLLDFQSDYTPTLDFPLTSVKTEFKREIRNDDYYNNKDSFQSSEFPVWSDLTDFDSSSMLPSTSGSEHGDVICGVFSSTTSDGSFNDMSIMVGSVNFDEVFLYEDDLMK